MSSLNIGSGNALREDAFRKLKKKERVRNSIILDGFEDMTNPFMTKPVFSDEVYNPDGFIVPFEEVPNSECGEFGIKQSEGNNDSKP